MEGYKLAHRIGWKAGGYARNISRPQSGRQQGTRPHLVRVHFTVNCHVSVTFPFPMQVLLSLSPQKGPFKSLNSKQKHSIVQISVYSEALVTKE